MRFVQDFKNEMAGFVLESICDLNPDLIETLDPGRISIVRFQPVFVVGMMKKPRARPQSTTCSKRFIQAASTV